MPSISLKSSPFWNDYLTIDNAMRLSKALRCEAVKAFFRSYQNNRHCLPFRIKEVEKILDLCRLESCSSDYLFNYALQKANEEDSDRLFFDQLLAYLRHDLTKCPEAKM